MSTDASTPKSSRTLLAIIGPGLLVAATGVGAGDLATSGFAGASLGTAVLWAVALGAFFKFVLTEGLARWQLVTGQTILEGAIRRFGLAFIVPFGVYFVAWSFFVGAALVSATAATSEALFPDVMSKLAWAAGHSAVGVALVWAGGFRFFERLMAVCVGVMFVTVIVTAWRLQPDVIDVLRGLTIPAIPQFHDGGLTWTIALMGGVGGTLTIICYGYWIRSEGREGPQEIGVCRLDLGVGYLVTALFSLAMIVIASRLDGELDRKGLIPQLANLLGDSLGPSARLIFLVGAWAAVFSSLLGVWQSVPSIFEDLVRQIRPRDRPPSRRWYLGYLLGLGFIPLIQVGQPFQSVQKWYAVVGAWFIPALALILMMLLTGRRPMGAHRNRVATTLVLVISILFFLTTAAYDVYGRLR